MATVQLDVSHLSSYLSIPQTSITALLDQPTVDLVRTLLEKIYFKAREHEELGSEKLKLDIELENAVRSGDVKARLLKKSIDKGLSEAADLRQKLEIEEKSKAAVEAELQNLQSTTSSATSEATALRSRITSLESSNRDALSSLESKTSAYDKLAEELGSQHQKILELRREKSTLDQSVQSANAALLSTKYRDQGFQQEIESLKRTNEWLDEELKTKSEEHTKFRKEKSALIAELQRQNEEAATTIDALRRTDNNLRKRLEEVGQKADDALSQVQQMQEEDARKEEAFKAELNSANRLADLMKASAQTERQRHQDLQTEVEQLKDDAAEEIGRITAEAETEHQAKEAAEQKINDLEVQIERLENNMEAFRARESTPGTPRPGMNGNQLGASSRFSPARGFSPNASRIKGGLSMTQMYSDYNSIKAELETEKRRNEKLSATIDEMIQDLESRQPEIEEMRTDHGRLEANVVEMSTLVDSVSKERDQAKKEARRWEGQVDGMIKEGEVLRQQLRDLSSQIKILLLEVHVRDQGTENLSIDDRTRLEQIARGDSDVESIEGATDTGRYISQHLTTFKNIDELQKRNSDLLKLTRELGDAMEGEEARRKRSNEADNERELLSLRGKVERFKDEMRAVNTQSQSYIRERDMFRRMLTHKGQIPPGSDITSLFSESAYGGEGPRTPRAGSLSAREHSPPSKDLAEYGKLLKDLQNHFDSYRQESAVDRTTLKEQVDSLSRTNGELRGEAARSISQVALAHERYEMLQGNYNMLKAENNELQKRSHALSENAAKHDLRTQQVVEDLVEAKGVLESMRNETANLKAEKDFWRNVERRLTEDNESLLNERAHLNTLTSSLQNLLNEREQSDSETRRRLQAQVENLESELQTTKRKLSDEVEDGKRVALRKEYEHEQSQKRIDDLVSSLASVREQLIAIKTTRDHLQARVDEMTIELRSAEERVQVLHSRPTRRPSTNGAVETQHATTGEDEALSKEQELTVAVSELKRDLELAQSELENAKSQVEQYKSISQASEEELQSLNDTQDQYREEMDKLIDQKDAEIRQLQLRVEDITSELSLRNTEVSSLLTEQSELTRRFQQQKEAFESEMARLRDQDDRHATAAQFHQEDLKAQAEIAQQAQQNYENELVKHAEAAKTLQKVRADFSQLKVEAIELKTEADSTRASLAQSEESWAETKERYEQELADMKTRREDVMTQNKFLHQQLESITHQISTLQKEREIVESGDVEASTGSATSSLNNLQEVIKYLRREKEIVDIQLELSSQESKRLKQQLDYTQSRLDETSLKLSQQRRAEGDSERNLLNHNKLMETINELNLFRESSVTLRNETREAQALLVERSKRVEELTEQIEPLQSRVRDLENDLETEKGEMKLLQEDRDRWQQRTQHILHKYDRVDPAEMEAVKEQIKTLQIERDELAASKEPLQSQVNSLADQLKQAQEQASERLQDLRNRLSEQFKTRSKELGGRIKERDDALQSTNREKVELEEQLGALRSELETAKSELDQAAAKAAAEAKAAPAGVSDTEMQNGVEEGQVDEGDSSKSTEDEIRVLREKADAAEAQMNKEAARYSSLQTEVNTAQSKVVELETQMTHSQQELDAANTQLLQLQAQHRPSIVQVNEGSEELLNQLRQDLANAQQDADTLRITASINASTTGLPNQDDSQSMAEQVTERIEAIRKELESRHDERIKQADDTLQKRTDVMKRNLTKKLVEGRDQIRQQLQMEHAQAVQKLKVDHHEEIEALKIRHREEVEELQRTDPAKIEQLHQEWLAEHPAALTGEVRAESNPSEKDWSPSDAQVRDLVATNPTVKSILSNNIRNRINAEKEGLIKAIKEEQQKIMAEKVQELESKATSAREQAVLMEGKRYGVKISMTENRAKIAQAKLDIVQHAASETPQKPVVEVWNVAKDAKPPPAGPQQSVAQSAAFGKPSASGTNPQAQSPRGQGTFGQSIPPQPRGTFGQPTQSQAHGSFGQPTPARARGTSEVPTPQRVQDIPKSTQNPASPAASTASPSQSHPQGPPIAQESPSQQPPAAQVDPNLPAKPPQSQQGQRAPAVLRGLQQSGLPVARGGARGGIAGGHMNSTSQIPQGPGGSNAQRGASNIGRGRGRGGQGRGGNPQMIDTSGQFSGQQAPSGPASARGGMSATAKQFVPQGNKRPREDSQDSGDSGNGGKRARGGGAGA